MLPTLFNNLLRRVRGESEEVKVVVGNQAVETVSSRPYTDAAHLCNHPLLWSIRTLHFCRRPEPMYLGSAGGPPHLSSNFICKFRFHTSFRKYLPQFPFNIRDVAFFRHAAPAVLRTAFRSNWRWALMLTQVRHAIVACCESRIWPA